MTDIDCTNDNHLQEIRNRVKYEDQLLNTRTGIILTINGLVAIAKVVDSTEEIPLMLPVAIFIINLLWLVCAIEAWRFIRHLSEILRKNINHAPVDVKEQEEFISHYGRFRRFRLGPTKAFGLVIPIILCLSWAFVILTGF